MAIYFISDLHLEENTPKIGQIFLNFLQSISHKSNKLYILGDFFESWIGDDDLTSFNQMIIDALSKANAAGLSIYFMHGNRDFLIGRKFLKSTGCTPLPDEYVVNLEGTPTLLMHGDTLCTLDTKYLKFRKKARSWWYKFLVSLKSLNARRAIAAKMRAKSKEYTRSTASYIMDVTQSEVELRMHHHSVQHLIHGHTHKQSVHHFELNQKPATRTVLGAWHENGNALKFDEGKQEFIILSSPTSCGISTSQTP